MRTKPFTTSEFFNQICTILKEKEELPTILDYALATSNDFPIPSEEFRVNSHLDYGGSEGIYLDLYLKRHDDEAIRDKYLSGNSQGHHLGTFKTLENSQEAMRIMGTLLADFIVESTSYVNKNLDDFNWLGYDVYPSDEKGENIGQWKYTCSTVQRALDRKEELLEKHDFVTIVSNSDKERQTYSALQKPLIR